MKVASTFFTQPTISKYRSYKENPRRVKPNQALLNIQLKSATNKKNLKSGKLKFQKILPPYPTRITDFDTQHPFSAEFIE